MLEDKDLLEHTNDAGSKIADRVEDTYKNVIDRLDRLEKNTSNMAEDVILLKAHNALLDTAHATRETVNDTLDTSGDLANMATKTIDVPLAITEDVIDDARKQSEKEEKPKKRKRPFKRKR